MDDLRLHIVSFNVPYPPDYGGVIDVYYKIRALHALGVQVHLHCFCYGRPCADSLHSICTGLSCYPRLPMWRALFSRRPFIVETRHASALLANLSKDNAPVLFDGLHCCYYLGAPELRDRMQIVRMHNDESEYYRRLGMHEKNLLRRLYFHTEYKRLLRFEDTLAKADAIFCIAPHEAEHYAARFANVSYLGPFHGHEKVRSAPGRGSFALYHGNLGVSENVRAALFLVEEVFSEAEFPLVIAGKDPHPRIREAVHKNKQVRLVENPGEAEMEVLVAEAHVHVLPAFQDTGIKLKLLHSLFTGRFCLVNPMMVENTGLGKYCTVAGSAEAMRSAMTGLFQKTFTQEDIAFRRQIEGEFSDSAEAEKIIRVLAHPRSGH